MTICDRLSDRMPAVAAGHAAWTAEEGVHLDACADCRAEWELVEAAQGLGAEAALRVDPAVVAANVLARVRDARHADRRRATTRWALTWGGLAAAAALLLAVLLRGSSPPIPDVASVPAVASVTDVALHVPLPELDGSEPEELQAVLDELEVPLGESSTLDEGFPGDDVTQLDMERVLRAWEG